MPGLVRENGERASGLARGDLAFEREPVQVVAALGGQVGEVASDDGGAVSMLDDADVLPGLVALDRDGLSGDARGLARESRRRLGPRSSRERIPARSPLDEPEDERERADHAEAGEEPVHGRPPLALFSRGDPGRLRLLFVTPRPGLLGERLELLGRLARVGDPQLVGSLPNEEQLVWLACVAVALAIDVLRAAICAPRRSGAERARRRSAARGRPRSGTRARSGPPNAARRGRRSTRARTRPGRFAPPPSEPEADPPVPSHVEGSRRLAWIVEPRRRCGERVACTVGIAAAEEPPRRSA